MRHSNFQGLRYKPGLKAAGLNPATRIHDLRHSAASIALARGANVKEVQQILGHASATVTLDTYSHVFPSLAEQLRDGWTPPTLRSITNALTWDRPPS